MGVLLHSVLARKRDWIAEHGTWPTVLRVDAETRRQLLEATHAKGDLTLTYVYGLRLEIVDAPEWLEVL